MAIFRHSLGVISCAKGASPVAAAAYRHATQMTMSGQDRTKNYSGKQNELVHSEVAVPADAAAWVQEAFGKDAFQRALAEVRAEA